MNTENSIPKQLRVLYVTDPGVHGWCGLWAVPPIFSSESDDLCLCIARNLKKKALRKGEYMCRSGDEASSICFINRGVFSVQLHDIQFELLGPGSCFGEIGAFITDCRTMDVVALDDSCEILELFIADYNLISSQSPEFALIIQERLWELGNTRMQKLQKACKKFTKGADDLHPTALVLSSAVKAMKDLEKKRRVRIWHEVYDQETVEHRLQALVLTLPYGSKLRAAMHTLADAERIIGDTLAAALEMSGLDGHSATCIATCPWVDDAPKIVVAELIARSRYIAARFCAVPPRIAHVLLLAELRATAQVWGRAGVCKRSCGRHLDCDAGLCTRLRPPDQQGGVLHCRILRRLLRPRWHCSLRQVLTATRLRARSSYKAA